jgi:hypothetical protein
MCSPSMTFDERMCWYSHMNMYKYAVQVPVHTGSSIRVLLALYSCFRILLVVALGTGHQTPPTAGSDWSFAPRISSDPCSGDIATLRTLSSSSPPVCPTASHLRSCRSRREARTRGRHGPREPQVGDKGVQANTSLPTS